MLKSICEYTAEQRHTQVTQVQWVRGHVALCRSRSPRRLAPICGLALQPTPRVARRPPPFKNLPVSNGHKTECEPPLELRIRRPDHAVGDYLGILMRSGSTRFVAISIP